MIFPKKAGTSLPRQSSRRIGWRRQIPIGGGFGRIFKMGDQPVSANIAAYYDVALPTGTSNWQLRRKARPLSLSFVIRP
jgi:hypothetical protein